MALSRSKKQERLSAAFARLPNSAQILLRDLAAKGVGQDAPDVLAFFNRIARRLPQDRRTVTAFTAPQDLAQAISQSVQDWALPQLAAQTAAQEWNKVISPNAQDEFRLLAIANALSAADPDNLRSVPQIIHWLQTDSNRALPEDLPGIKADLKAFERIKPDLALEARDVTAYPHIHSLRATLPKTAYSQDQRKAYEAQALQNDEAKLLWQDEHNHACLIHITSETGAQRLGRGTDWCTAWGGPGDPDKKSLFREYFDNLLYWRIGAEVYQVHFSSVQFKDAQDEDIELKSLITVCPEAVPALISVFDQTFQTAAETSVWPISDILTACHQTGDHALQQAAYAAAHLVLPQAFQKAAENGLGDISAQLLTACQHIGDAKLLQTAISALTPVLEQTFQTAAEYGSGDRIAQLLTACKNTGDVQLLETAISALTPVLEQTFQTAAKYGRGDDIALLLTACQNTGDVQLLETAISALTPNLLSQTFQKAAKHGRGDISAQLLTACKNTGDIQLLRTAISALTPHLDQTFQTATEWGSGIAQLLTACQHTGDQGLLKTAISALTPNLLSQTFQKAAKKGREDISAQLLTACQHIGDAKLLQTAISALTPHLDQTFQTAAKYGRGDDIAQLLTACHDINHPALTQTVRTTLADPDRRIQLEKLSKDSAELKAAMELWDPPVPHTPRASARLQPSL